MRQSTNSDSLKYRLVQQGIAALEQGQWQTALQEFVQILQHYAGSVQIFVNPMALINLHYYRITIMIGIDEPVDKLNDSQIKPTIYVGDNLTNYSPEASQQNLTFPETVLPITPTEPEVLNFPEFSQDNLGKLG